MPCALLFVESLHHSIPVVPGTLSLVRVPFRFPLVPVAHVRTVAYGVEQMSCISHV